ncbi:MAG: hypothetical protein ABI395_13275, partial [Sphingobium sp.]
MLTAQSPDYVAAHVTISAQESQCNLTQDRGTKTDAAVVQISRVKICSHHLAKNGTCAAFAAFSLHASHAAVIQPAYCNA